MANHKPNKIVSGIKRRRKQFAAAHDKGMKALHTHDYDALGEAILEERQIIEEQAVLVRAVSPLKAKRKNVRKARR